MVALAPDLEKIASDYLRTHSSITTLQARVVGKTPTEKTGGTALPWVRVTQLDARSGHRSDHLISYMLQFDCYAGVNGGQPEANTLARTVRKLLKEMPDASHSAKVSGAEITGHARIPDTAVDDPARERVVLTAEIWAHA